MRLLIGIAAFTVFCMLSVALIADHLANVYFAGGDAAPASRIHLIHNVTLALDCAQNCRRAFLATGESSYLEGYRAACADADASLDRLVDQDHQVTSKLAHAEGLREIVHTRLSEIGQSLEATAGQNASTPLPLPDAGLARIQKLLDSLAGDESRDISGGLETARTRSLFHRNLVIALAAINLLFLGGVAFCAIQIGRLHSLVTMCAWSKRIQCGDQWIPLEEYMQKRFGIRISHGISQEEYEKWAAQAPPARPAQEPPAPEAARLGAQPHPPRAAA